MSMDLNAEQVGPATVLSLKGRLDGATSTLLDGQLSGLIETSPITLIDMGGLDYVSSAGLRILLKAAKQAKARRSRLMLCALHPHVREVFDISGFSTIFTIHPDRTTALAPSN